jgi:hypothetical protein
MRATSGGETNTSSGLTGSGGARITTAPRFSAFVGLVASLDWGSSNHQGREVAAEPGFARREPDAGQGRECGREDSNLQGLSAQRVLNPSRLPVPPRPRGCSKNRSGW